jgi:hypothetical protein
MTMQNVIDLSPDEKRLHQLRSAVTDGGLLIDIRDGLSRLLGQYDDSLIDLATAQTSNTGMGAVAYQVVVLRELMASAKLLHDQARKALTEVMTHDDVVVAADKVVCLEANRRSPIITDESLVPDQYKRTTIDMTRLGADLNRKIDVPGAVLDNGAGFHLSFRKISRRS